MTNLLDVFKPTTRSPLIPPLELALASGELISLDTKTGWRITCRRGHLWLSTAGKRGQAGQDIELRRGDTYTTERRGRLVIEASGYATFDLIAQPIRAIHPAPPQPSLAFLRTIAKALAMRLA